MIKLFVLVACEESQAICKEFRNLGHEAYSCDLQECSGDHPEWHVCGDCLPLLNGGGGIFYTQDGSEHALPVKWDLIIAHPPCTHLSTSGARWFEEKRKDGSQREAIEFFCKFLNLNCDHVAIENPRNIISGKYIPQYFPDLAEKFSLPLKPTQDIQPYYFGDPSKKTTSLWMKGLPKLKPTNIVEPKMVEYVCKSGKIARFSADYGGGGGENGKRRSKTYPGIAREIARQWSEYLINL